MTDLRFVMVDSGQPIRDVHFVDSGMCVLYTCLQLMRDAAQSSLSGGSHLSIARGKLLREFKICN